MTKESQDARGGTWPPPAVFEVPEPVDLLASALELVHKDDLQAALGVLQKAQILKRPLHSDLISEIYSSADF